MGQHTLIVSMPNVSPFSYYTLKEGIKWLTDQRKPATGLFDRTHQVLTDITGHKRMFEEAGYEIAELYSTSGDEGVSGDWEWKKRAQSTQVKMEKMVELKYRAYKLIARRMLPKAVALLKRIPIDEAIHTTAGY